ncbi:MAG: hypothetical protein ABI551_06745, partial [Polyangiaceae bacterium]
IPVDPRLPKKRARSIDEVKAAQAAAPTGRRNEDHVVVRDGSDPREHARAEAERSRRESSTFNTFFLQAQANRTRWLVGMLVTVAVLAIYFVVRRGRHKEESAQTAPTGSAEVMHVLSASAVPLTASDLPPPPTTAEVAAPTTAPPSTPPPPPTTLPHASSRGTKVSLPTDVSSQKPPAVPTAATPASSNARTDVARSL